MVKVGPKLPPPSRRELNRQERELKRAQSANIAQLGEPREHLALLVHRKSRSKRPEASALGNSWKRWEKNQRRHEARRLAKAKASITSLGSHEYVDISQSDLLDYDCGKARGPTSRGDNCETPLPNLDSSAGEINDYSLGSISGDYLSITDTSISLSSAGNHESLENSTLAPSTTPRLGVDIVTGDFWTGQNALSTSVSGLNQDNVSMPAKDLPKEPMHIEKPAEKVRNSSDINESSSYNAYIQIIDRPKIPSQVPPVVFSRISSSRRSQTTMNAAMAPPRLSSRKSSVIFSEPLDMSKYSNKSYTPTINGDSPKIEFGTFGQGSSDFLLASGKRVDTTPKIGSVHGPNLTPRAQVSAYGFPTNPVQPADQSYLAARETSDWNSRSANRILPAVDATSARTVLRVASDPVITRLALTGDDPVETGTNFNVNMDQNRRRTVYDNAGAPPPLQSNARLQGNGRDLSKGKKPEQFSNSPSGTTRDFKHNSQSSDTIQKNRISSRSQLINADTNAVTPSLNGSAMVEFQSKTPVLAPAARITHDKKKKSCELKEIQPSASFLEPRALENGAEGSIRYPDTPPTSCSGIVPPASTPRSPLLFALGISSPSWSRPSILPRHTGDTNPDANTPSRGFVSALKWMLRKTLRYFWQRRG